MGARERSYYVDENNMLHEVEENDGYTYMRRGAQRSDRILCAAKDALTKYPYLEDKLSKILGADHALRQQTTAV